MRFFLKKIILKRALFVFRTQAFLLISAFSIFSIFLLLSVPVQAKSIKQPPQKQAPQSPQSAKGKVKSTYQSQKQASQSPKGDVKSKSKSLQEEVRENPYAPHRYSFKKKSTFKFKIGTAVYYSRSEPYGFSRGNASLFSRGDFGFGESGLSLHFDLDARFAQGFFSPNNDKVVLDAADPFYQRTGRYYSGQQMDYLDISHLYLSYNWDFVGIDFGRIPISEAAWAQVDGVQLRLLFEHYSFGLFAGLKVNPFSAQVVGAASGGRIAFNNIFGFNTGNAPIWGGETADRLQKCDGQTQGSYANELGTGLFNVCLPWGNLGSLRFQTFGTWLKMNLDFLSMDTAFVVDTFMDSQAVVKNTGQVLSGNQTLSLDRIWLYNKGSSRVLENLNLSWRGSLDVIGARPLWLRDLILNLDWRKIGPFSFTLNYSKVNTHATAWSYARFFRPLERPQEYEGDKIAGNQALYDKISLNNTQIFVVNRDRISALARLQILDKTEIYSDLRFERRADFVMQPGNMDFSRSFQAAGDEISSLGSQFSRCLAYKTGNPDNSAVVNGEIAAVNPSFQSYIDPCKVGISIGLRDPFMFGYGYFDLNFKHMLGYFSSTSRFAFNLGFDPFSTLGFDVAFAYELNQQDRVYSVDSVCTDYDSVTGEFTGCAKGSPSDKSEAGLTKYGFIAMPTHTFQVSTSANWNVIGPWFVQAAYDFYIEELPFQGDYGLAEQGALGRDTWQISQQVFLRSYLKF